MRLRHILAVIVALGGCTSETGPSRLPPPTLVDPEIPPGFQDPVPAPGNPLTLEGIELGRRLFHDPILSADGTLACAGCHAREHAFTDHGNRFSTGVDGSVGTRNAPSLANVAWVRTLFWDGRAEGLEDQAGEPVADPAEMGLPWPDAVARLRAHPEYPDLFAAAFGSIEITRDRTVQAIAQFERTLVSAGSRYDRSLAGEVALAPAEERGRDLFFTPEAECFRCHGTLRFTTDEFFDIGLDLVPSDPGREVVTGDPSDRGRFRAPSLRNVEHTAPYMHDGRFATLEEVLDHYAEGVRRSPNLAKELARHPSPGLGLTAGERADLVAFLETLSDPGFLADH